MQAHVHPLQCPSRVTSRQGSASCRGGSVASPCLLETGGASGIYCLWTRSHSLLLRPGERWCPSAPGPPPRSPSCSRAVPGPDPPHGPPGLAACLRWRRWAVGTRLSRRTRTLVARGTQTRGLQAPGKQEETWCGCSAPSIILPWQL